MDFLDRPLKLPLSNRIVPLKYALVHAAYWILITGFFLYEKRYLIYKASLSYFTICVVMRVSLLIGIAWGTPAIPKTKRRSFRCWQCRSGLKAPTAMT